MKEDIKPTLEDYNRLLKDAQENYKQRVSGVYLQEKVIEAIEAKIEELNSIELEEMENDD